MDGGRGCRAGPEHPGPDANAISLSDRRARRGLRTTISAVASRACPRLKSRDAHAGVAQLAEYQPSKLNVDGSNPFARFLAPARITSHVVAFVRRGQGLRFVVALVFRALVVARSRARFYDNTPKA